MGASYRLSREHLCPSAPDLAGHQALHPGKVAMARGVPLTGGVALLLFLFFVFLGAGDA